MYSVSIILYTVSPLILYPVFRIWDSTFCIMYPESCFMYLVSCILYIVSCFMYLISCIHILYPVSCVLYPVSYIFYPVSCILYPVSYILYPASYILYPVSYILYVRRAEKMCCHFYYIFSFMDLTDTFQRELKGKYWIRFYLIKIRIIFSKLFYSYSLCKPCYHSGRTMIHETKRSILSLCIPRYLESGEDKILRFH